MHIIASDVNQNGIAIMLVKQTLATFPLHETLDSRVSEMLQLLKCTIYVYLQKSEERNVPAEERRASRASVRVIAPRS